MTPTREFKTEQTVVKARNVTTRAERLGIPDDNPNVMPKHQYRALVAHMVESGCAMLQPILVRNLPDGRVEIVDGEHRFRAVCEAHRELGREGEWIPVVATDMSEDEARFYRVSMNRIRGNTDTARVSEELRALNSVFGLEALANTGFELHEVESLMRVATDIDAESVLRGGVGDVDQLDPEPEQEAARVFELKLYFPSSAQLKRVKQALRRAAGKGVELGVGLVKIVEGES